MSKSYYDILGVSKSASAEEIKKAFRAKAKEHHPDKGGDEKTFKTINQAYEVLGDPAKKAQYDQFGEAGVSGNAGFGGGSGFSGFSGFGGQDFSGFGDIFSEFFGGMGGQRGSGGRGKAHKKGSDLEMDLEIRFEESMNGVKQTLKIDRFHTCDECKGVGGSGQKNCSDCRGSGIRMQKFQTPFGVVQNQTTCNTCSGKGHTFESTCKNCKGEGRIKKREVLEVDIPAGIENGATLRLRDKGDAGVHGGGNGDLYIHIYVRASLEWKREGLNLITSLEVPILEAIMGSKKNVKTFWGSVEIQIPEKTKDQQVLRIAGKGVKRDGQTGDHLVIISHQMPKKISSSLKAKLEEAQKLA